MAKTKKSPRLTDEAEKRLLRVLGEYRREATEARKDRLAKSRRNWDMYYGNVDWSHKVEGQSTEHLPKLANAVEQMAAFVKRGLVQFGDWFSVDTPRESPLTPEQIRALLMRYLTRLVVSPTKTDHVAMLLNNATKQGLLESMIVLKVHGYKVVERTPRFEPGNELAGIEPSIEMDEQLFWRLRIDLIPTEDYLVDPTGRGLYEIHRVERDLADVWEMAEAGVYDKAVVGRIEEDMRKEEESRRRASTRNQNESNPPNFRKRVVIEEFWGTILGDDGRPEHVNVVTAVANDKYVIRKPEPNPLWHRESPFVARTVIQNPHTVWSKALYDDVVSMNVALDELFNLILDSGISSVWGIKQVRLHWLEDPRQVSGGIPPGTTLAVNEDAPADAEVVQAVVTGKMPREAFDTYNITDREMQAAMLTNDVRLGFLPQKAVKATEIVESQQSSAIMLDSFVNDLEYGIIEPMLFKAWLTILQNADDLPAQDVVDAIGVAAAFKLSRMHPAERYAVFARGTRFKAHGLSATLSRARDFQKLMALSQGVGSNPVLLEAFVRRVSADKMLDTMMRALNINPESIQPTEDELQQMPERMERVQALAQTLPSAGGSPPKAEGERGGVDQARSDASAGVESAMNFGES